MEAVKQPILVTCSNCGAQDTGTFCSTCGAELHATPRHPFRIFLDTFLKLGDIKAYVVQYATLARAPVRHTIRAFEEGHLHGALRFTEWSLGLYTVLVVSQTVVLKAQDWIAGLLLTLTTLVGWSVAFWVYYLIMRRKSPKDRSFRAFLTMGCLYVGFVLPIVALGQWVQLISPMLGTLLLFGLLGLILLYAVRVWTYFWELPGKPVLGYFFVSGLVGGVASTVFTILVFSLFPGSRFGLLEFDKLFSVDASQFLDPFLHVHIDGLAPYTHTEGLFSIDVPEGWTVVEMDTLDQYLADWQDPAKNALISVHLIQADADDTDDNLGKRLQGFVRSKFRHPMLFVGEPVPSEEEGVQVDFWYSTFGTSWQGLKSIVMQGRAYAYRHGAAVVLFSTLVPSKQQEKLEPPLTAIRNSLEVQAIPDAWITEARTPRRTTGPLHPVEITGFVRYVHPEGVFALDVPEHWQITSYDLPNEATVQWQDPFQNGLIVLKVMLDPAPVPRDTLVEQTRGFLWSTFARDATFVIDEPVWEAEERLRLGFSSESFIWTTGATVEMQGTAYVERRGPFLVIFCTFLPAYEVEFLAPHLTHIRNSIEVYREVLWYSYTR